MPDLLTVRQVCETALEKIGAFSTHDTGADQDELHRAAKWLDMVVGHLTAEQRALWLIEDTVTVALTAATASYDLLTLLDTDAPSTGIQFPIKAQIRDSGGVDYPCEIITREQFENISDKDQAGRPTVVYIDRIEPRPTAYFWPVPPSTGSAYSFRLVFQRYSTDATAKPIEKKILDLRKGWNLWAVTALAAEIGDGPVRKLPDGEVTRMRKRAEDLLFALQANDNQEQASMPRRTAYNDL